MMSDDVQIRELITNARMEIANINSLSKNEQDLINELAIIVNEINEKIFNIERQVSLINQNLKVSLKLCMFACF